jgi:hypothetical protein
VSNYPEPSKIAGGVEANTRHVNAEEAMQAADYKVGEGTPKDAPWRTPDGTHGVRMKLVTLGISAKAKLAALLTSTLGSLSGIGITWLVTGELDKAALAGVLSGLTSGLIAFIGAFLGDPGDVVEVGEV